MRGSVYSSSILLAYILYKVLFGYFKIDISNNREIFFHSIVDSKCIKTCDIVDVKENFSRYTLTHSKGKISYSNYPDNYRAFTAEIQSQNISKT